MHRKPTAVAERELVQNNMVAAGVGGSSAQRECQRRHDARQERVRARHPKIGGLLLALVGDPSSTKVWAQGAAGERAVAERLDQVEDGLVLHDRRLRTVDGRLTRANIDHIVIVRSGVWVIDAKTHKGRLEVRRAGGFLTPRTEQLWIGGRDQTALVEGIRRQVDAVRAVLAETMPDVPIHGALCFYGTELPWIDEDIAEIPLRGRRGIAKLLRREGTLTADRRDDIHRHLDATLPPA